MLPVKCFQQLLVPRADLAEPFLGYDHNLHQCVAFGTWVYRKTRNYKADNDLALEFGQREAENKRSSVNYGL